MTELKIFLYGAMKRIMEGMGRDRLYTVYDWKDDHGTRTRVQLLYANKTAVVFRFYPDAGGLAYSFMFWHVLFPDWQDPRNPQAYNIIYDTVWPRIRKATCEHRNVHQDTHQGSPKGHCLDCDGRVEAITARTFKKDYTVGINWQLDVEHETWTSGNLPPGLGDE